MLEIKVVKFDGKFLMPESATFPVRFGIVSAFTHTGTPLSDWQADRALCASIREAGFIPFRVVCLSNNKGDKAWPSYGFAAPDTKSVAAIAAHFSQDAFFWINNDKLQLKDTKSLTFEHLGGFREFLV